MSDDLFFADNTVLVNIGHIDRMDLLGRILNGQGRWCATVESECSRSSAVVGLEALRRGPHHLRDSVVP